MSAKVFDFSAGNLSSTPLSIAGMSWPFVEQHHIEGRRIARRLDLADLVDTEQRRERHVAPPLALVKAGPTTLLKASSKLPG
jgi:hypothetical protein